ncbi:hypothetical protein [Jeotgalibacillus proteolyticus]|uniref:hypothetical protein n=1 Tax=Jeotgalibacillus proteolyticus TaxID=2082395 RepID=UPI00142F41C1|nr:hypothetical protein [Jeotgalibacillus proteolyticus]
MQPQDVKKIDLEPIFDLYRLGMISWDMMKGLIIAEFNDYRESVQLYREFI